MKSTSSFGKMFGEDQATDAGEDILRLALVAVVHDPDLDLRLEIEPAVLVRRHRFLGGGIDTLAADQLVRLLELFLADLVAQFLDLRAIDLDRLSVRRATDLDILTLHVAVLQLREVEAAKDDVLRRRRDRAAVRRLQDVVLRQHQHLRLEARLDAQRDMHGHLVTVEVRVERRAGQRVKPDRLAFNQLRHERLDAQAVQGWCTVEQHWVVLDDVVEDVVNDGVFALHHLLGGLDRGAHSHGVRVRG